MIHFFQDEYLGELTTTTGNHRTEDRHKLADENALLRHDEHLGTVSLGTKVTIANGAHCGEREVIRINRTLEPELLGIHSAVEETVSESDRGQKYEIV